MKQAAEPAQRLAVLGSEVAEEAAEDPGEGLAAALLGRDALLRGVAEERSVALLLRVERLDVGDDGS